MNLSVFLISLSTAMLIGESDSTHIQLFGLLSGLVSNSNILCFSFQISAGHTHTGTLWDFSPHKSVDRLPFVSAVASGVLSLYCNWEKDQVTHCFTSLSIINRVIVPISLSYLLSDFVNCLWGAAPWWQKQTLQFDIAVKVKNPQTNCWSLISHSERGAFLLRVS